ncbi:MAG TPA: hypothetical protein VGS62_07620 [Streptosporangiaceae bacterium]|nr:hypothetical protein [Streptosporangiaceae bacterium]
MSPQSRRHSQPPGGPDYPAAGRHPSQSPPAALFAEMLRAARELLAVRSPLDAELLVSELLGTWWGTRPRRASRRGRPGMDELVGESLVEYAAGQGTPAALALLSGIACLGTPGQTARAERAALELIAQGVARPRWADHLGAVTAGDCYLNPDAYGDRDEVVCEFSYAGEEPHALVCVVDYNTGGMLRDGWVTTQVGKLLEHCHQTRAGQAGGSFRAIDPPQARKLLDRAFAATEESTDPLVSESFPSYHAFIRTRIRTLPPRGAQRGEQPARNATGPILSPLLPAAGERSGRRPWSADRRAMLVAEFLASDEAEDLSDRQAASRCADHIVAYGCDQDFGRPLRMSPVKAETFLLDWLPRKVMLSAAEQEAIPHVLAAWTRWAGRRCGQDKRAIAETLDAVFDATEKFAAAYRDPTSFGLDAGLLARLLPDSDLEALPRRAFAFPLLSGWYGGVDLGTLDPSDPADRRILLAADHDEGPARQSGQSHLERHLALADRLWRGDPPDLWEAAQRLLDLGEDRHAILHTLIDAIRSAGPRPADIRAELAGLPPIES